MKIEKTKILTAVIVVLAAFSFLTIGCGSSSGSGETDTSRIISGEIVSSDQLLLSKSAALVDGVGEASCIDTVCSVRAMNTLGEGENGQIFRETNRWQVRLRHGTWMIGFYDGGGELVGRLEVNGEQAFRLESGGDLDLGMMTLRNRFMMMLGDVAGLGENGFRSAYGQDLDFDGVPDDIDDDVAADDYDPSVFSIIKVKPFDGQENVAPCRPVKIVLNQPLDETTINSDSIIVKNSLDETVEGVFSYFLDEDSETGVTEYVIKFAQAGGFELGDQISVSVPSKIDGLLNVDGEPLEKDYAWAFIVRDFGGTSYTCHDCDEEYYQWRERERERAGNGAQ